MYVSIYAVVSEDEKEEVAINALRKGAVHFLLKPIQAHDFIDIWKYVKRSNTNTSYQVLLYFVHI